MQQVPTLPPVAKRELQTAGMVVAGGLNSPGKKGRIDPSLSESFLNATTGVNVSKQESQSIHSFVQNRGAWQRKKNDSLVTPLRNLSRIEQMRHNLTASVPNLPSIG